MLLIGIFVLYRGDLVLFVRQNLLSVGQIKAIGRFFQQSLG
jgi:hypothetical protein